MFSERFGLYFKCNLYDETSCCITVIVHTHTHTIIITKQAHSCYNVAKCCSGYFVVLVAVLGVLWWW